MVTCSHLLNKTIRWYFYIVITVIAAEKSYSTSLQIFWRWQLLNWSTLNTYTLLLYKLPLTQSVEYTIIQDDGEYTVPFDFEIIGIHFFGSSVIHDFCYTDPYSQRDVWLKQKRDVYIYNISCYILMGYWPFWGMYTSRFF